jgi:hypothetical protein
MWERLFRRRPEPLTGAPQVRRMKVYPARSGYVYQYYYLGHRPWCRSGAAGTEYVFEVSPDRRTWQLAAVLLPELAMASREARLGRALISAERYAIAKLTLFQAFDERSEVHGELLVRTADLDAILQTLGIE